MCPLANLSIVIHDRLSFFPPCIVSCRRYDDDIGSVLFANYWRSILDMSRLYHVVCMNVFLMALTMSPIICSGMEIRPTSSHSLSLSLFLSLSPPSPSLLSIVAPRLVWQLCVTAISLPATSAMQNDVEREKAGERDLAGKKEGKKGVWSYSDWNWRRSHCGIVRRTTYSGKRGS